MNLRFISNLTVLESFKISIVEQCIIDVASQYPPLNTFQFHHRISRLKREPKIDYLDIKIRLNEMTYEDHYNLNMQVFNKALKEVIQELWQIPDRSSDFPYSFSYMYYMWKKQGSPKNEPFELYQTITTQLNELIDSEFKEYDPKNFNFSYTKWLLLNQKIK